MECTHPQLTHIVNIEMGGQKSTTYRCDKCMDLFTVDIKPLEPMKVVMGTPK
jgi:hypothetical protein